MSVYVEQPWGYRAIDFRVWIGPDAEALAEWNRGVEDDPYEPAERQPEPEPTLTLSPEDAHALVFQLLAGPPGPPGPMGPMGSSA